MLKKWMILPIAAGFLAVNAGAACTETVKIGSITQLNDFRDRVNRGNPGLCAELTNDIVYDTDVVAGDKSKLNDGKVGNWTPIGNDANKYAGVFDGKGFTISGLVVTTVAWEPSLFAIAGNGAVIKNVNVRDSYFAPTDGGAAGILGALKEGSATIDNCSFDGLINGGKDNGGLVGSLKANTTLTLTNSYNTGKIGGTQDVGGLVGYLEATSAKLVMDNCYSAGVATSNALVGNAASSGTIRKTYATVNATNVGCLESQNNCKTTDYLKSGVTKGDAATLETNYLNNKNGSAATINAWNQQTMDQKVETLNNQLEQEINVEKVQIKENWFTKVTVSKTNVSDAAPFAIKQDVVTDIITFDREYESGVASTIIVPFDCGVSGISNAKFYEFASVEQVDGAWKVRAKQVSMLNAHTPYFVMPTESGKLTFENGPYVLKANVDAEGKTKSYEKSIGNTAWKAVGVYTKKRWDVGVNEEEIGKIYGFAAQAKSDKNPGDFVRGGKKVAVLPMRSYLKYDASTDEESVVSTPTLTKMRAISSTEIASIEALPQRIEVELEDAPERVESIDVPGVSEEGEIQEGQDDVLGIAKNPMIRLDAQKADRWFNVNGRNMNVKPKSQGAFIKNSTPVIVK